MSYTPRGQHAASMYLQPDRPTIPRLRSNSLPVGLAMLNAQEAGMLFSAAEKATARRRRPISIDSPAWPVDSPMEDMNWPLPSASTIKPSPLRKITSYSLDSKELANDLKAHIKSRALQDLDTNQIVKGRTSSLALPSCGNTILKSLPVDPVSPTRRQVTTRSLKSYADGIFLFTQNRLVSSVPQVKVQLSSPTASEFNDELDSSPNSADHKSRPSLESRFSDWSVSTRDQDSRPTSINLDTPPVFDMDLAMMTPDSFFGGFDAQAVRKDLERLQGTTGYASSETYGPNSEFPFQPSPKYQPSPKRQRKESVEEFSYFANYDKFMNQDTPTQDSQPPLEPPESLTIEISPVEQSPFPPTPPPPKRARAETMIRQPVIARSCSSGPMTRFAHSSPSTPYHVADVAIRVPNWCVGAMG